MLETDTEKNSSYGSKPALPRAGEQKKRACEEFQGADGYYPFCAGAF